MASLTGKNRASLRPSEADVSCHLDVKHVRLNDTLCDKQRNRRCYNMAYLYFRNNDLEAAEKCARDAIALEESDKSNKLLGDILLASNRKTEALLSFQRCLELNPKQEEVFLKVCDLICGSEPFEPENLRFWMDKAEKEGFYEVAQKFKERIESNVAFPGRSHLNAILKNVHQNDSINGSLLMNDSINSSNRSTGRQSLPSSDTIQNTSHDSPSQRFLPTPTERTILTKIHQQETLLKNILQQQEKLIETQRILMSEVTSNRTSFEALRGTVTGLKTAVNDLKTSVDFRITEITDTQKELRDALYDLQLNNDYNEDGDDGIVYQETAYNQQAGYGADENRPYEPISPAPLNIQNLPNFNNMGLGSTQSQAKPAPAPTGVFSRLGSKPQAMTYGFGQQQPILQNVVQPIIPQSNNIPPANNPILKPLAPSKFAFGGSPGVVSTSSQAVATGTPSKTSGASGTDVEVIYVKTPPLDLVKKAESLKLPKSYYNYLDKEDCKGCRGCEPQDTAVTMTSTIATPVSSTITTIANITPKTTPVFSGFGSTGVNLTQTTQASSQAAIFGGVTLTGKSATDVDPPKFGSFGTPQKTTGDKPAAESTPIKPFSFNLGGTKSNSTSSSDAPKFTFGFNPPVDSGKESSGNLFSTGTTSSFSWGGEAQKASWMVDKPSLIFGQKVCGPNEDDDEHEDPEEDTVDDSQFKPVVALPELVEVKTGEEDEETIYCQRAKLYRYDGPTKQWKERGLGDLKILKHKTQENKFRMVLRREQVLKIACNHYLAPGMKFTPMANSETAVCWYAMDYAEGCPAEEQFAVKFKNKDILKTFTAKIDELLQILNKD